MTVIADNKKRVTLPSAKPGDRFDLADSGEGMFVLRRLEPVQARRPKMVKPVRQRGRLMLPVQAEQVDWDALVREIREERDEIDARLPLL